MWISHWLAIMIVISLSSVIIGLAALYWNIRRRGNKTITVNLVHPNANESIGTNRKRFRNRLERRLGKYDSPGGNQSENDKSQ